MPRTIIIYDDEDLLTADQAADHFGYTRDHFRNMLMLSNKAADPRLIRLKIETDETWRKTHKSRARFVFRYQDLKAWYMTRQRRKTVRDKHWARRGQPSPVL